MDFEYNSIKAITEEELKRDNWKSLKHTDKTHKTAIEAVYSNSVLKSFLKLYLSDADRNKKRITRACSFTVLKYDKILLNKEIKNQTDKDDKIIQVNDARHELMKMVSVYAILHGMMEEM